MTKEDTPNSMKHDQLYREGEPEWYDEVFKWFRQVNHDRQYSAPEKVEAAKSSVYTGSFPDKDSLLRVIALAIARYTAIQYSWAYHTKFHPEGTGQREAVQKMEETTLFWVHFFQNQVNKDY